MSRTAEIHADIDRDLRSARENAKVLLTERGDFEHVDAAAPGYEDERAKDYVCERLAAL